MMTGEDDGARNRENGRATLLYSKQASKQPASQPASNAASQQQYRSADKTQKSL